MKIILFWGLLIFSELSLAAPFLISNPYPEIEPQPLEFEFYISGVLVQTIKPTQNPQGQAYLHLDMAKYSVKNKDITIRAKNGWGISEPVSVHIYTHSSSAKLISLTTILSCTFNRTPITCF